MSSKIYVNDNNEDYVPPRGHKCITWLPFIKAKVMERTETSTKQRLFTSTLAINSAISFTYTTFNLSANNIVSFSLNKNDIIHSLMDSLNKTVWYEWIGIQDRNNILDKITWNTYLKKANNYIDQYKNTVADKLFIPIFDQCIQHTTKLSLNQYTYNNQLQQLFQSCLVYTCIYSLLISEVGFHHSKPKPIITDTALVKNRKIKSYLKHVDPQISIFEWKEQEDETTHKESKICERVRLKCIKYIENALQNAYQQFYTVINGLKQLNNINLDELKISVKFNKQKRAVKYPQFDPTPIISSKYFNTDFYRQQINTKQSISDNGKQRPFQLVNNYGVSRVNTIENRSNIRKYNIETNIQTRRNDMNIRNEYNYNIQTSYDYGGISMDEYMEILRQENDALKSEKELLMQQLQMEENNYNISYDISTNSNVSSDNWTVMQNENGIVNNSPIYFADYNEMI